MKDSRAKAKRFSQFSMYLFIFEDENMYFLKTWNKKCAYLADCLLLLLEIRFRKNLAKLTGPAVRLDSKKPKGEKKDDRKKTGNCHAGI